MSATPETITKEEYGLWLTPIDAMKMSGIAHHSVQEWMIKRLIGGKIRAAALLRDLVGYDQSATLPCALVTQKNWENCKFDNAFWASGDFSYAVEPYGARSGRTITFFSVRICPEDITAFLAPETKSWPQSATIGVAKEINTALALTSPNMIADAPEASKEKIGNQNLKRVAKLMAEIWGTDITALEALAIARGCFPNHHIGEKRFLPEYRLFREHKNPGPKPKIVS